MNPMKDILSRAADAAWTVADHAKKRRACEQRAEGHTDEWKVAEKLGDDYYRAVRCSNCWRVRVFGEPLEPDEHWPNPYPRKP